MAEVLILGSAGFVGSNIANYMVQHTSSSIATVDSLASTANLKNLQPAMQSKNRHNFYLAKAEDKEIARKIFELEQPKILVYNIASSQLNDPSEDAGAELEVLRFWHKLCLEFNVKKMILLLDHRVIYDKLTVAQEAFVFGCEELILRSEELLMNVLVPCYVFGPRQKITNMVPNLFKEKLQGNSPINLSSKKMEMMYIKDYFFNILNFIEASQKSGLYIMCNNEVASEKELDSYLQCIADGIEPGYNFNGNAEHANSSFVMPPIYFAWTPNYNLASALEHTMCWYDVNRWAWEI